MKKNAKQSKKPGALRPVVIKKGVMPNAEGSAEIRFGDTRVICTASVETGVPSFLRDSGKGWVTAEYGMLPRSTHTRKDRDRKRGPDGRAVEIQRLIGRSLRAAVDMELLGENTIKIDCDVIQADGGTRTASITGAYIALAEAIKWMMNKKIIAKSPLVRQVAAISVGIVGGKPHLDLCYEEDVAAEVDFNVVMVDGKEFVEVQGTAEHRAFTKKQLDSMLELAKKGINELMKIQNRALRGR